MPVCRPHPDKLAQWDVFADGVYGDGYADPDIDTGITNVVKLHVIQFLPRYRYIYGSGSWHGIAA